MYQKDTYTLVIQAGDGGKTGTLISFLLLL